MYRSLSTNTHIGASVHDSAAAGDTEHVVTGLVERGLLLWITMQSPSLMPGCLRILDTGYWLCLILKYAPILTLSQVGGECVSQVFKHAMPICSRGLQGCGAALLFPQDCARVWATIVE